VFEYSAPQQATGRGITVAQQRPFRQPCTLQEILGDMRVRLPHRWPRQPIPMGRPNDARFKKIRMNRCKNVILRVRHLPEMIVGRGGRLQLPNDLGGDSHLIPAAINHVEKVSVEIEEQPTFMIQATQKL